MSAITAKASRKMKKYAVLTREPRCFLGSFDFSWEQRKLSEMCGTFEYGLNAAAKEFDGKNKYIRITDIDDASREFLLSDLSSPDICLDGMSKYLLSSGDIVFARTGASVGKTYIYRENDGIVYFAGFLIRAKVNQDNDAEFVFQSTLSPSYEKYIRITSQRSGQPGVNAQEYGEYDLFAPSKEEQQRIGQFLRGIDNLITLHQRKCALLFSSFQALISMMFTTSTFSWEQRKAKELFVSTADKGYPELPVLSATQDRGMIRRDENSINIFHDKKNEAGYKRVLPGQFVIHLRSFQGGFAHSAIEGITSPAYTVFGFSEPEKHDSEYWKYVFTSKSFIRRLETVTYGIRDGRSISYDEFLTLGFVYPSKAEQTAIARYLDKLSDLITLHQRKCISFTGRAGRLISTVNKKRITSSWEQRKLGDIADIVGGGTPSTGNQSYWDGDIDWYAPAEIADQIYANSSQKKITGLGYENSSAKMLPPGTVLFTSRAGIGKTAILTRKGCTNQGFQSIVPHRGELDSYFIFSRTEELKRYGELVGAGSTFVEVSGKQMAVMELMMPPTMREQQTIGGFFQQLDNLITLHQRKPFLMKWRTSDANRNQTNRLVL